MRLAVRVTPRGKRDAIDGWMRDEADRPVLKLRVSAAADDGAANAAVIALLAESLDRPKTAVRLLRGAAARVKQIEIDGLDEADAYGLLGAP